ncbi:MAG: pepsin-like aspartyl protease [Marinicella sp.]|nr:hypothetical protein [Xanthomonadales bacterium]
MTDNKHIRFPINIAEAQGAYHLELLVGSQQIPLKLLIDTGSSTIAFHPNSYSTDKDHNVAVTQIAQCVTYGIGGWAGPVLNSTITYSNGVDQFEVHDAFFSIIENEKGKNFLNLDGILGLAYHHLNKGYHMESYFEAEHVDETHTYPWAFNEQIQQTGIDAFKKFIVKFPEKDITPSFTAFAEQNVSMNKFALSVHRSIVYVPQNNMTLEQKEAEPLNQGLFVIGDAEAEKDLYVGAPQAVKVVHDAYYNTNLLSVKVAGFDAIQAPPLDDKHVHNFFSNAIIDSGCSYLMLQKEIYQYVINAFKAIDPNFIDFIESFKHSQANQSAYIPEGLNLALWPDLFFTFEGVDNVTVTLRCCPDHYWQLDALGPGQAFFTLLEQIPKWPDQSLIGLPIISSYFCIFDRACGKDGVIKFAEKLS